MDMAPPGYGTMALKMMLPTIPPAIAASVSCDLDWGVQSMVMSPDDRMYISLEPVAP